METTTKKKTQSQTLDKKHQDMMQMYFVIENETIPNLQCDIKDNIAKAKQMKQKKSEAYYDLIDLIRSQKQELKSLQTSRKEYLLENSKYIFHYYEEKQKISNGENRKDTMTINQFFKIKGTNDTSSNLNSD